MKNWTRKTVTWLLAVVLGLTLGAIGVGQGVPLGVIPQPPQPQGLRIEVWTDKASYQTGDTVNLFFTLNKDAYVYIYNVDAKKQVFNIFPNEYSKDNFKRAGTHTLPDNPGYVLRVFEATGQELFVGIASEVPIQITKEQVLGALLSNNPGEFAEKTKAIILGVIPDPAKWATDFALFNTLPGPIPSFGELAISSDPIGAAIYIDDLLYGFTPKNHILLTAGHSYLVRLEKEGYDKWSTTVFIEVGKTASISTTLNKLSQAVFTFSPPEPYTYQVITFDASASSDPDGSITNYEWDFGSSNFYIVTRDLTGKVVRGFYTAAGTYTVTLTITDNGGAKVQTSQTVTVRP